MTILPVRWICITDMNIVIQQNNQSHSLLKNIHKMHFTSQRLKPFIHIQSLSTWKAYNQLLHSHYSTLLVSLHGNLKYSRTLISGGPLKILWGGNIHGRVLEEVHSWVFSGVEITCICPVVILQHKHPRQVEKWTRVSHHAILNELQVNCSQQLKECHIQLTVQTVKLEENKESVLNTGRKHSKKWLFT